MKDHNIVQMIENLKDNDFPNNWRFIPVDKNKAPMTTKTFQATGWTKKEALTKQEIIRELCDYDVNAVGLALGKHSVNVVAIDHDGESCDKLIEELTGLSLKEALPSTVAFSSGRTGRYQKLYSVSEDILNQLTNKQIKTGEKDEDGKSEQLEFRVNGYSIIMGFHPKTQSYSYHWLDGCSPQEIDITPLPEWWLNIWLNSEKTNKKEKKKSLSKINDIPNDLSSIISKCQNLLSQLKPFRCDNYDDWNRVGMALHHEAGDDPILSELLLDLWTNWSQNSNKFKDGECATKWQSFDSNKDNTVTLGTLVEWAKEDSNLPQQNSKNTLDDERQEFYQMLDDIDKIYEEEDYGFQQVLSRKIAKKYGYNSNISQMLKDYWNANPNLLKSDFIDIKNYVKDTPRIDYLISNLLPTVGLGIFYGESNMGKTTLLYSWMIAIATGKDWNGFNTIQGKCLIYQLEESQPVTSQRLSKAVDSLPDNAILIKKIWNIAQIHSLKKDVAKHQPKLVIIDSLKAASAGTNNDENDSRFADSLYQLHQISESYQCAIFVIHHCNSNGGLRGSTAIKAAVDTVMKFGRDEKDELPELQRLLTIEKSRALDENPTLLLEGSEDNVLSWTYLGTFDGNKKGKNWSNSVECQQFIDHHPNQKFTVDEVLNGLKEKITNRDTVKKTLNRLVNKGKINKDDSFAKKPLYFSKKCPNISSQSGSNADIASVSAIKTVTGQPEEV